VHRNITPRNILIRETDGVAKLGDLVLAKAMEGTSQEQITRSGELVGQLEYLSPEQTTHARPPDARSDIYSLGASLYALLTGRPPFEGRSVPETIQKIQTEEPGIGRGQALNIKFADREDCVVLTTCPERYESIVPTPGIT
jgi:serine/threonine-protein kinase